MTLIRDWMESPNQSTRGSGVSHIVLHTAQGALTYQSLGNFFSSPSAQVSSHVGIDDTPGVVGEYVYRDAKAWTAGDANPYSVQAELCAFAEWDRAEWDRHPNMLANAAAWVAEEAALYGIPLRALTEDEAQNPGASGVCQHADLGAMGGGHWDCSDGFPLDRVLEMAGGGGVPQPITGLTNEELTEMFIGQDQQTGRLYLISGNTKLEFPSGGSTPGSPGHGNVYADEWIRMLNAAYPAGPKADLVALNHDIVTRIPDVFSLIDVSTPSGMAAAAQAPEPNEVADPAVLEDDGLLD